MTMPRNAEYVIFAYGFVFAVLAVYTGSIFIRLKSFTSKLKTLQERIRHEEK